MEHYLGLPPAASAHAGEIDKVMGIVHLLMLALFVGWGAFYLYVIIRFRRSKNPVANYRGVRSNISLYLVAGVAIFEAVLIIGYDVPIWAKRVKAFPPEKDAVIVRVVAEQFAWNIHYPGADGVFGRTDIKLATAENPLGLDTADTNAKDDITTINQLYLPVDKPVIVRLSSKDVVHGFSIPEMRVKQDAIPGEVIPVWFIPKKNWRV